GWTVAVTGSHTTGLMPITWPPPPPRVSPRLTKKTLLLFTVATSMAPENDTEMRGCRLKPSSVLSTSMSAQSFGRAAQFGLGRATRTPELWLGSATVNTSLANGPPDSEARSKPALTPAARAGATGATKR